MNIEHIPVLRDGDDLLEEALAAIERAHPDFERDLKAALDFDLAAHPGMSFDEFEAWLESM